MRIASTSTGLVISLALLACPAATEPGPKPAAPGVATGPAAPASAPASRPAVRVLRELGLATPESVLHDPERDVYLVANIHGSPLAVDDNGFISLVSPEGQPIAPRWIDGARDEVQLDAPKGMALVGDALYVADITQVRCFDRRSGQQRPSIPLPGASFVNDLAAAADGTLYASDSGMKMGAGGLEPSGTDAIWKIVDGVASPLVRGPSLGRPNGLIVDARGLVVVTMGSGLLYRLDGQGRRTDLAAPPAGSLDGVVALADGSLVFSSWQGRRVYRLDPRGHLDDIVGELESPADIGLDARRGRLLIPLFNDHALALVDLPAGR